MSCPQVIFGIVTQSNAERDMLEADTDFQKEAIFLVNKGLGQFGSGEFSYQPELAFQSKQTIEIELRGSDWVPEDLDKEWKGL